MLGTFWSTMLGTFAAGSPPATFETSTFETLET
jgi:hypothetical protein